MNKAMVRDTDYIQKMRVLRLERQNTILSTNGEECERLQKKIASGRCLWPGRITHAPPNTIQRWKLAIWADLRTFVGKAYGYPAICAAANLQSCANFWFSGGTSHGSTTRLATKKLLPYGKPRSRFKREILSSAIRRKHSPLSGRLVEVFKLSVGLIDASCCRI